MYRKFWQQLNRFKEIFLYINDCMKKMSKEEKDKIMLYIKYFVTSFVDENMPDEEKEIILKCFLYKRTQKDIQKMLESVAMYKKSQQ